MKIKFKIGDVIVAKRQYGPFDLVFKVTGIAYTCYILRIVDSTSNSMIDNKIAMFKEGVDKDYKKIPYLKAVLLYE